MVRLLLLLTLVAVVLTMLVLFVFPWLNGFVNVNDVTVSSSNDTMVKI